MTDYYRLLKPLPAEKGNYVLQIREFELERSYLDQFRLLAIDHPLGTKIDVSQNGEIYEYTNPFRLNRARLRGADIVSALSAFDSNKVIVNKGDTLTLSFSSSSGDTTHGKSILDGRHPFGLERSAGGGEGGGDGLPKETMTAHLYGPYSVTADTTGFYFRLRPTLTFVPMTLDSLNLWKVVWNNKARVDYFNFGLLVSTPNYIVNELQLRGARHSSRGDVRSKLSANDSNYTSLVPGDAIELRFTAPPPPPSGRKRSFILISRGRYEKIIDSTGTQNVYPAPSEPVPVSKFKLEGNFPNPFNPVTRIAFQLPVDGRATVIVYDLTGHEVARLLDGTIEKGHHTVGWNAKNNASGIYFCRYSVMDDAGKVLYTETQKLVVMR